MLNNVNKNRYQAVHVHLPCTGQLSTCSPLSYCLRFSGSRSTSYALRSFLNRPSAFALCSSLFCNSITFVVSLTRLTKHYFDKCLEQQISISTSQASNHVVFSSCVRFANGQNKCVAGLLDGHTLVTQTP